LKAGDKSRNFYLHNLMPRRFFVRLCPGRSSGSPDLYLPSLPKTSGKWRLPGKGFYSELIGIGITAAGPLPSLTGFPLPPQRIRWGEKPIRAPEQFRRL